MKKILVLLVLTSFMILGVVSADSGSLWSKYVNIDNNFSFHYPSGWSVSTNNSIVEAKNSTTDEQLLMVMIPFDPYKSPQDLASGFIDMLKEGNPNVRAFNWKSQPETASIQVMFHLSDNINGKEYSGLGMVIKSAQEALWFSYFAPTSDYYQVRGLNILEGFINSLSTGSASKDPNIDYSIKIAEKIENNSKAFMFVLEFALGAPFTQSQENVILDELKDGWRYRSEEELQQYDLYPIIMESILKLGQKDLEKLRSDMEKSIREWLVETDQSDRAVKIINGQLESRGKVVIDGNPPLTEMSLTAYSEMIAYSRMLQQNPLAKPEQISQESVNEIKQQVIEVWESFSTTDKEDIATSPGLWICLRAILQNGSEEEQDKVRVNLKELGAVTSNIDNNSTDSKTNSTGGSESKKPMDMSAHWCLMQMREITFNTYMWSHGYNYLPATGRMW
ncbi:hypothetical protein [Lutispora sp.]|uniref:hypothetical protein n=1 Tax=Lutispora sp. TaxID=2828727 RepID=UPI0035679BC8